MFDYEVDTDELDLVGMLEGDGLNLRLQVDHPLIREQRSRLDLGVALRVNESSEDGTLAITTDTDSIEVLDFTAWQRNHYNGSISNLSGTSPVI